MGFTENEGEGGVLVHLVNELTRAREVLRIGCSKGVLAVVELQDEHRVVAPGDLLVAAKLSVLEMDIRLPVDIAEVDLGVHGQVEGVEILSIHRLVVARELITTTSNVTPMGDILDGHLSIILRLKGELLISANLLTSGVQLTAAVRTKVLAEGALERDHAGAYVLQSPDLLLLHGDAIAVDSRLEFLGSEILAARVDQSEGPLQRTGHLELGCMLLSRRGRF